MNSRSSPQPEALVKLLDATERICATTAPSEITMRRIAAEAGVSPGLAYHYVSSKDDLIGMLLVRIGERLSRRTDHDGDPRRMLESLWQAMTDNPAFYRLMAWLVLEGRNTNEMMSRYPLIADIAADAAEQGARDPALVGRMLALLGISFQTYETLVNRAIRAEDFERLRAAVLDMFVAWYTTQFDEDGEST